MNKVYILKNIITNFYLTSHKRGESLWTDKIDQAALYDELTALRVQRHLEHEFPNHKVVLQEK